jgi:hypothetical protein
VAAAGLILTALLIALVYRREFLTRERLPVVTARILIISALQRSISSREEGLGQSSWFRRKAAQG